MNRSECESRLTRREFLTTSSVLVAGVVSGCATASVYRITSTNGRVLINPADYPELAQSGGMIQLRVSEVADPLILVRQEDVYQAFSAVCTHLRCFVRPSKHFLLCPCHGSTFDLEGNAVRGPAEQPLARYRTEMSADGIVIHIE
jgi:Rieske Fe-S protein